MAREYYNCSDLAGVFVEEASRYVCMYVSTCLYMSYIYVKYNFNKTISFVEQFTLGSSYTTP